MQAAGPGIQVSGRVEGSRSLVWRLPQRTSATTVSTRTFVVASGTLGAMPCLANSKSQFWTVLSGCLRIVVSRSALSLPRDRDCKARHRKAKCPSPKRGARLCVLESACSKTLHDIKRTAVRAKGALPLEELVFNIKSSRDKIRVIQKHCQHH